MLDQKPGVREVLRPGDFQAGKTALDERERMARGDFDRGGVVGDLESPFLHARISRGHELAGKCLWRFHSPQARAVGGRSEERRVGKGWVSTGSSRWAAAI